MLFNNEVNAEYIINKNTISEEAMIKMYNNVTDFPIWKAIISIQMEHYSNNEVLSIIGNYANVFNPTENDITYIFNFSNFNFMNIYIYEIENDGDQIEIDFIGTDKQQLG